MNTEKNILSALRSLSDDDKKSILARRADERINRPKDDLSSLTNIELVELDDFKDYCKTLDIIPTKRQASKRRQDFIKWLANKNQE